MCIERKRLYMGIEMIFIEGEGKKNIKKCNIIHGLREMILVCVCVCFLFFLFFFFAMLKHVCCFLPNLYTESHCWACFLKRGTELTSHDSQLCVNCPFSTFSSSSSPSLTGAIVTQKGLTSGPTGPSQDFFLSWFDKRASNVYQVNSKVWSH